MLHSLGAHEWSLVVDPADTATEGYVLPETLLLYPVWRPDVTFETGLGFALAVSVLKFLELSEPSHAGRLEIAPGWFGPPWLL